jgi:hypothetical protein
MHPNNHTVISDCQHLFKLRHPFFLISAGSSFTGKTNLIMNLIINKHRLISQPIDNIIVCYGSWQPIYEQLAKQVPAETKLEFREGLNFDIPSDSLNGTRPTLILIDDLYMDAFSSRSVLEAVTKDLHHSATSMIIISQSIFPKTKLSKAITDNASYYLLTNNSRDKTAVRILGQQIFPNKYAALMNAFEHATSSPFGHLLIDLTVQCIDQYRLRSKILDRHPVVYLLRK